MNKPDKEYIVWIANGNGQYVPYCFENEQEAILHEKLTEDWYITRAFNEIGSIYFRFEKPAKAKPEE